jgi:hypothetical protein
VHSFLAQAEYGGEILCAVLLAILSGVVGAGGAFGVAAALFAAAFLVIWPLNERQTGPGPARLRHRQDETS